MNVGVLVVLKGRRTARGRPGDDLVRRMLRCPVGPPFNQRLAENVVAGWPVLVEDDSIDPAEQVFRHDLPDGSDVQALFDRVCALHAKRLDRCRPLWEVHVFDGLARNRIGLYFKTHHGLIDGIGFINVILNIVTRTPSARTSAGVLAGIAAGGAPGGAVAPARPRHRTSANGSRGRPHRRRPGQADVAPRPPRPRDRPGHGHALRRNARRAQGGPLAEPRHGPLLAAPRAGASRREARQREDQRRAARRARHRAEPLPRGARVAHQATARRRHARGAARRARRRQSDHDPAGADGTPRRHARRTARRHRGRNPAREGRGQVDRRGRALPVLDLRARRRQRDRIAEPRRPADAGERGDLEPRRSRRQGLFQRPAGRTRTAGVRRRASPGAQHHDQQLRRRTARHVHRTARGNPRRAATGRRDHACAGRTATLAHATPGLRRQEGPGRLASVPPPRRRQGPARPAKASTATRNLH